VAEVVPEFAANGKRDVTIEHLLTHTGGFARAPMRPEEGADRDLRVKRLESWRLDWEPGSQTEYHATSAYWALVEVIDRLTGSDYRDVFAERVAGALGLPGLTFGGRPAGVVPIVACGEQLDGNAGLGDHVAETGENFLLRFNEPEVIAIGVPGAGAVAAASDIALFYQGLLHNPGEIWSPAVLDDATSHIRNVHLDPLFNCPANRTLGLVVAGDDVQPRSLASPPAPPSNPPPSNLQKMSVSGSEIDVFCRFGDCGEVGTGCVTFWWRSRCLDQEPRPLTPETAMKRFVPTRSIATAVMALGVATVLALAAVLPFSSVRPMTVVYVAMLVTGIGMFLRQRVFAPATG